MRPIEWLDALAEVPDGYERLLRQAGGLAAAAWKLAAARAETHEVSTPVPSRLELLSAASELARRLRLSGPVPSSASLADECERLGLLVI